MRANPRPLWLDLCISAVAILAAAALTILVTPLIGGPAVTEEPFFYATSMTIGLTIYTAFRLIQRLMHQRTFSKRD